MSSDSYNRLQEMYTDKIERLEDKKKRIKLFTLGGTIVTSLALAAELISGIASRPENVDYYFSSDNVSIEQANPDDYRTKTYTVQDNQGMFTTFTFDDLEAIEPNVNAGYTFAPDEYLPENSSIGIRREESNPLRVKCNLSALGTLIAGAAIVELGSRGINKAEDDEEIIRGRMRR